MAEQRQTFRFRLPWSAASATSRSSQATQASSSPTGRAQSAASAQRRPLRPAGSAAPPTGQPPVRIEPPSVSPTSIRSGLPSRTTSRSPREVAPLPRAQRTSPSLSPSPSRGPSQQAKSIAPVTKPPTSPKEQPAITDIAKPQMEENQETKPPTSPKEQPTTTEIAEPQKEQREQENFLPFSAKPMSVANTTPQAEKMVETPNRKDSKQDSRKVVYETSPKEAMEIFKAINHEEPQKKAATQENSPASKADSRGEVFDIKRVMKIFGGQEHDTDSEGHENGSARKKAPLDKEIKKDLPRITHKLRTRQDKQALHDKPFSIITLTGENTGATMHLNSEQAKRERPIHIYRGYKARPDERVDLVTHHEGSSVGRKPTNKGVEEEPAKKLCVNNNAQGVNNSLIFSSSVAERNPGVHVILLHKEVESVKSGTAKTHETYKAEVSANSAERVTYSPNIRRRCLRGLLLESSDSDPQNSAKPRRHGCRAG